MRPLLAIRVGIFATLLLAPAAQAETEALPLTNWTVVATFRPDGTSVCAAKFPAPRNSQSLTLEARTPKGSDELVSAFTVGGLPPLLEGKRGTMRNLSLTIGSASAGTDLKADWAKGAGSADSKITVVATPQIGAVVQMIVDGGPLVVDVPLVNGDHRYAFDLKGAAGPMTAFIDCIRRWSGTPPGQ